MVLTRRQGRFYNRFMSGVQGFWKYGARLRRTKYSKLMPGVPCFMAITLTSSNESTGKINDAWSVLLKRIRVRWKSFSFIKMRTDEGVHGVLHVLAFNSEFITKEWLSDQWATTSMRAPVTWCTQCYGSIKHVGSYLLGYLRHHEKFRYGFDRRWMPMNWKPTWKNCFGILSSGDYKKGLVEWISFCESGEHYVYGKPKSTRWKEVI